MTTYPETDPELSTNRQMGNPASNISIPQVSRPQSTINYYQYNNTTFNSDILLNPIQPRRIVNPNPNKSDIEGKGLKYPTFFQENSQRPFYYNSTFDTQTNYPFIFQPSIYPFSQMQLNKGQFQKKKTELNTIIQESQDNTFLPYKTEKNILNEAKANENFMKFNKLDLFQNNLTESPGEKVPKGTKFFTNHNYGYKCSCSKTQCNRKYCECYNSGNYCIDCNCKNCENRPPINTYSNKRPQDIVDKMKKSKEICTCTKSGCNKNYCECFKSGNKCTSACRCIDCENLEDNLKNKNKTNYNWSHTNSIYIIKNKLTIENINGENENKINKSQNIKHNILINKKRNRDFNKKGKDTSVKSSENSNENENYFNDSLFAKKGRFVLGNMNMNGC